jgi:pimeloyl-ACP methyl ester carboxylesterase
MRLVQFETEDGLRLNGCLEEAGSDTTIVHVHGKGGNFYENKFVRMMYDVYRSEGFNFLSFNNRGHSSYVEAYKEEEIVYIGAAVEKFEDCLLDLRAAEKFARTLGSRVVFQGHSFGCEKIMFYSQHVNPNLEFVLLSPCDGYRLQEVFMFPETVEHQLERLRKEYHLEGLEWLPPREYGIRVPGVDYHVPIVAQALVDLMSGPAFELIALDKPWQGPLLSSNFFIYLGGRDPLQVDGVEAMSQAFRARMQNPNIAVFADGDHALRPVCNEVLGQITSWLRDVRPAKP